MFQVVVVAVVCGVASVLMVVILSPCFRCVVTIIVATLNLRKKIKPLGCGKSIGVRSTPAGAPAPSDLIVCDGRPAPVRRAGPGVSALPARSGPLPCAGLWFPGSVRSGRAFPAGQEGG